METMLKITSSSVKLINPPPSICCSHRSPSSSSIFHVHHLFGARTNGAISRSCHRGTVSFAVGNVNQRRSRLESLFCYDKAIPEEVIEKPVGISLAEKDIGGKPRCPVCEAKGATLCSTCSGSGLYVDSILESQGIIVKVRCLGCGGTGNIMCSECGGRGHL